MQLSTLECGAKDLNQTDFGNQHNRNTLESNFHPNRRKLKSLGETPLSRIQSAVLFCENH